MLINEYLLSSSIALVISSTAVYCLHHSNKYLAVEKIAYSENLSLVRSLNLLEELVDNYDTYPFKINPIIHQENITYKNGELNPLSARQDSLAKMHNSLALSSIKLALHETLVIKDQIKANSFQACNYLGIENVAVYKSYLALGFNTFSELVLENYTKESKTCLNLDLLASQSMFADTLSDKPKILVPILSNYTLYQDTNGNVRKVTHLGAENSSNQAIFNSRKLLLINFLQEKPAKFELNYNSQKYFKHSSFYHNGHLNFLIDTLK